MEDLRPRQEFAQNGSASRTPCLLLDPSIFKPHRALIGVELFGFGPEDRQIHIEEDRGVAAGRRIGKVRYFVRGGRFDHRGDAGETLRLGAAGKLFVCKGSALHFIVGLSAVVDGVMKPDRGVDCFRIREAGAIILRQRKQRADMGKPVIVAAFRAIKGGKLAFQRRVDQGRRLCHRLSKWAESGGS